MEAQVSEVQAQPVPIDRKATRTAAIEKAQAALAADGAADPDALSEALTAMVDAFTPTTKAPGGPRVLLEKADPADVAAYFASTGLIRKELAAGAGTSTSVIATVQNPNGDRWSKDTFEAKKVMIDKWAKAHSKEIKARQDNEAAEAAAKAQALAAKTAARTAREAAAAAKAAAPKATAKVAAPAKAPASLAATKAAAQKPGRPSKAARQANRKSAQA